MNSQWFISLAEVGLRGLLILGFVAAIALFVKVARRPFQGPDKDLRVPLLLLALTIAGCSILIWAMLGFN